MSKGNVWSITLTGIQAVVAVVLVVIGWTIAGIVGFFGLMIFLCALAVIFPVLVIREYFRRR